MKNVNPKLVGIAWFIFVLVFVTAMFTVSFFLTAYLYDITNLNPPALFVQLINSLMGLVFAGLMIGSVAKAARSRGWIPEMHVFGPIIEALEKIAQGDFSIRLENEFRENQIVSELANSVNRSEEHTSELQSLRHLL